MNKTVIRAVSFAASAVMMFCAVPTRAFAAEAVTKGSFTYSPAFAAEPVKETCFYSDSWFAEPSYNENVHLRTMSMALSLSTMEVGGSSYVSELLGDIGFKDIAVADMAVKPTMDTVGTAIGHKKVNGQELVAVAIRGSKYDSEWASNLFAGAEGDIRGFSEAAEKVKARLKAYISENQLDNVKLWITGYSRGGTAADLAGVYINEHCEEFSTSAEDVFIYTFEAPAASVSDKVYDNIHETRNRNDIINYVYPGSWGIHSNGRVQWIGEDKVLVSKVADVGMQGVKVRDAEAVAKDGFVKDFMEFISGELTREKFSGDFDGAVRSLIELYFGKSTEDRQVLADYFNGLKEQFSGENLEALKQDEDIKTFLGDDIYTGIFDHNSDKMYEKMTDDLKAILTEMYNKEKAKGNTSLAEEDLNTILDSLYPILRKLGPVIVKDMHCHIGLGCDDFLPEDYNDPDFAPGYYEEEPEEHEPETEAEKGAADGKSAAWVGYTDGSRGEEKYTSYNDVPDDGEEHTEEYLEAYKAAYRDEYEVQYSDGVKDFRTDYQKGWAEGDTEGSKAARNDLESGREYGAGYNDEPVFYEDDDPLSEEYIRGYKDGYKSAYEISSKERSLYHIATFALNFSEIIDEHRPQNNWELVKSLDSYYTEETRDGGTDRDPATGAAGSLTAVLLLLTGAALVSGKRR